MPLYDGFFDAVLDEETGEYDRAYASGDFTAYFENTIGSGVCVNNDPDSFKVRFAGGEALVSPGYLFIRGYWLHNDADYSIPLTGTSTVAIAAHLNLGKRMVELTAVPVADEYPDSLVLALVDPSAGTVEDTRHNSDICGVILTAGELSRNVEWALNYIDTEIESKLDQVEADIAAQDKLLDEKLAEAQNKIDSIEPLPVGSIKFSAAEDPGEGWLKCNGEFITAEDYPELVEVLGKLEPNLEDFQVISAGEVGAQISNGVVYNGRMWVFSFSTKKLYGVGLDGDSTIQEVSITFVNSSYYSFVEPSITRPIALSIVPRKVGTGAALFLGQGVGSGLTHQLGDTDYSWMKSLVLIGGDFNGSEENISLAPVFTKMPYEGHAYYYDYANSVPYVISKVVSGVERYYALGRDFSSVTSPKGLDPFAWTDGITTEMNVSMDLRMEKTGEMQRIAFSKKNKGEAVSVQYSLGSATVYSEPDKTFSRTRVSYKYNGGRTAPGPLNIVGEIGMIFAFTPTKFSISMFNSRTPGDTPGVPIPTGANVFVDAGAYLWSKGVYLIFVGTGIIFSKTLEAGSFGYLDTTPILGTISNFGYLDYSEDENTLYLMGQDSSNQVKVAKLEIGNLFEYTTEGAFLPNLKMANVPAYIKAKEG